MVNRRIVITNPGGIDMELADRLCRKAIKYKSIITFAYGNGTSNAKSFLSVISSGVGGGEEIELFCEGIDEEDALVDIIALLTQRQD